MWKIKQIFDGDYGCEELQPGQNPRVSVTLTDDAGNERLVSVEDAWLLERGLDVGSRWPMEEPEKTINESCVDRIRRMEAILDEATEVMDALEQAMDRYKAIQEKIGRLEAYYTGEHWKQDYDLDQKGHLPANLKRGVLSEDAIFDLLDRNREIGSMRLREEKKLSK